MNPNPLADLRDIHLPVAPGWWLLLATALLLLVGLGWLWWRGRARRRARRQALRELEALGARYQLPAESPAFLQALSTLLRRTAIWRGEPAAGLCGQGWAQWLIVQAPAETGRQVWEQIALDAYRPDVRVQDPAPLLAHCRRWLEQTL